MTIRVRPVMVDRYRPHQCHGFEKGPAPSRHTETRERAILLRVSRGFVPNTTIDASRSPGLA
jgi:hypothetical protein